LQHVEEREPNRLLHLGIPVQLHVRGVPERVQVIALLLAQPLPPVEPRRTDSRDHLVAQRGQRAPAGPPVGQELRHPQPLTRRKPATHRHPGQIRVRLAPHLMTFRAFDDVVHRGSHP
jgi:hypothetical protein